jgi:hypothetical protein
MGFGVRLSGPKPIFYPDRANINGDKKMTIKKQSFGKMPDGTPVELYTLTNTNGLEAKIINYGGIIVSLCPGIRYPGPIS